MTAKPTWRGNAGPSDGAGRLVAPGPAGRLVARGPAGRLLAPGPVGRRGLLALGAAAALPALVLPAGCASGRAPDESATLPAGNGEPTGKRATPSPAAPTVISGGGPVPNTPGKTMLGAYLDLDGVPPPDALALRRRQLGRDLRIVHVFYAWSDSLPRKLPGVAKHSVMMVSWRGAGYDEILSGANDKLIARAARQLIRYGKPVLLRWGWEMNGDWYTWGGPRNGNDPARFVACWRRLRRIFRQEGARNVAWVWSPNWNSSPDEPWNRYPRYYPGDDAVDWVGVSGYNLHRETPQELFNGIYADYALRKPIMITEVGAVDRGGRTKADWITRFAGWVDEHPAVGGVVWFDTDTHPGTSEAYRIDTGPEALAAYRAMARAPRFSA